MPNDDQQDAAVQASLNSTAPDHSPSMHDQPYKGPAAAIHNWLNQTPQFASTPLREHNQPSSKSLEWDDSDMPLVTQPPEDSQQDKRDAVRQWVNMPAASAPPRPTVTRAGRQIKPRVFFDPADEEERQKGLRASLRKPTVAPATSTPKPSSTVPDSSKPETTTVTPLSDTHQPIKVTPASGASNPRSPYTDPVPGTSSGRSRNTRSRPPPTFIPDDSDD